MRIVLIGDFGKRSDEGMRGVCAALAKHVSSSHNVQAVSTKDFCSLRALPQLIRFEPTCLHYLTGPTVFGLIALRAHKALLRGRCVTIATGLRPYLSARSRRALKILRPDIFLAQARRWARTFAEAGSIVRDFPNPIDTAKFRPVEAATKRELRERHGFALDERIVLHVGHVRANRNLESLIPLQAGGAYRVLVVGSESFSKDVSIRGRLEDAGCRVITSYQPQIEQMYQLADYYAFPVLPSLEGRFPASYEEVGCIDLPLTILEALACGLPVVSTEHDAVRYFLGDRTGVEWFDGTAAGCADALNRCDVTRSTRHLAEPFETREVGKRLDEVYALVEHGTLLGAEMPRAC